ncbi:MAG: SufD family Fe-S cluster assembly protein [Candidatus Peregrinibacteria bacterium]
MKSQKRIPGPTPFSGPWENAPAWVKTSKTIMQWHAKGTTFGDHLIVIPASHSRRTGTFLFYGNDAWTRLLLYAGKNAEVSIAVELNDDANENAFTFDCILERAAHLTVTFMKGKSGNPTIRQSATVGKDATLNLTNITQGSCIHTLQADVTGEHGELNIDWTVHTGKTMHCNLSACTEFHKKYGGGKTIIRGVCEGSSVLKSRGTIVIGKKATGSEAHLDQKILLLDSTAKADAIPEMKIETNDVKASHASTVSRIAPEDLFYFSSRGISGKQARKMYVEGFLAQRTTH